MNNMIVIHTKWGNYPVHKNWLDPVPVIVGRYEVTRRKGRWSWDSEIQEWVWEER